ncbi:MAG: 23S rRNA (adenine(2503)-C(2))-methyltransferase RlmN [Lachnospiraceae bacterium]|nr:23S rRNA (adenine(2503)-C(2))-methyltransferase RlmN [Lachnospiraceae bacterium]MBR4754479.1 23S rRNA (adenine(2503)-C(2))-methyltransferase RlmN [Lachnospiraceae bacterium]MBR4807963.1 23S rRNA (adenine(2503)-C(2))-methyltransferase RlmN [Lachnospiraceae bacterium]
MEGLDIRSMTISELENMVVSYGENRYRGAQLFSWFHEKKVQNYDQMTNISKAFREKLKSDRSLMPLEIEKVLKSELDGTRKYLFRLCDNNIIESVLMRYKHGNSVCISSQVGCRMGCRFCASTIDGLERNLNPSEMLSQVYNIEKDIGERVSNIVVMGSGEPLDNYDNLIRFIELVSNDKGINISQRNITVSTCGIVPKIYELANLSLQITLAISLHAPNQEKRKEIMPVANKYDLNDLLPACSYYFEKTGRRLTFEYSLIKGVNDSDEDADSLCRLLKGLNAHINLIPVNPIEERQYRQSEKEAVISFKNKLEKHGRNVTIRREMGRDINGACGQLRRTYKKE